MYTHTYCTCTRARTHTHSATHAHTYTHTHSLTHTHAHAHTHTAPDALIATWREKGCSSFWRVVRQFPVLRYHIVCWKTCFVIHRAFRDGFPDVSSCNPPLTCNYKLLQLILARSMHQLAKFSTRKQNESSLLIRANIMLVPAKCSNVPNN